MISMKEKFRQFMSGRYGADQLNRFLSIAVIALCVIMLFFKNNATVGSILSLVTWGLLIYSIFRMFSRNYEKRSAENRRYLEIKNKITSKFDLIKRQIKDRKTHKYYSCPQCGKTVRVPKGKGKIRITCPNCANSFIKET